MLKTVHFALSLTLGCFWLSMPEALCLNHLTDVNDLNDLNDLIKKTNSLNYITQFKDLAIEQQHLTGIPASIKLAMALLESNNGQSLLATKGNNHFGLKWWNAANDGGAYIETIDDDKDKYGKPIPSRFIKFNSVEASYRKHSDVLKKARYQVLFTYQPTDYRAWALGLEACGYATAKGYGMRLIDLIERYHLTQYDVSPNLQPETITFEQTEQTGKTAELTPVEAKYATPQYKQSKTRAVLIEPVSHAQKPVLMNKAPVSQARTFAAEALSPNVSKKNVVHSQFINSDGQVVHYTLYEVDEPVKREE